MMELDQDLVTALAGRYEFERELGRGGMAMVYLARDLKHHRQVALKVLRPELGKSLGPERFLREIAIAASLVHPNILTLHDSDSAAGHLFYVMPYVNGPTLGQRLKREVQLRMDDALMIARQIAAALDYAHARGVIHRDIKPDNILLHDNHAYVADFGLARAITSAASTPLTDLRFVVGTPAYMSPEQCTPGRAVDARSDIYSLGCVVFEMITGVPPFRGATDAATMSHHLTSDPPSLRSERRSCPPALDDVVRRALAKAPADRFRTAGEFVRALEYPRPIATVPQDAPNESRSENARSHRSRLYWTSAAGVAVVAALAAWVVWWSPGTDTQLNANLIAVAPFEASTAQLQTQSRSITDQLARNLDGVGPLRAVPPSAIATNANGSTDLASARELARRVNAGLTLVGSVQGLGSDSVRLTGMVYDLRSGGVLGEAIVVGNRARLVQTTDSLFVEVLRILSRARRVGAFRVPLGTPSLPAFKAYLSGEHYFRRTVWDSAQSFFERAIELDSNFALAHRRLYGVLAMKGSGVDSLVWFHALHAGRLNRGLSLRDSLLTTADSVRAALARALYGDWTLTAQRTQRLFVILEVAARRFPEDAEVWYQLGLGHQELSSDRVERYRFSLDAFDRAIALDSEFGPAYLGAIEPATHLRGPTEAAKYVHSYLALNPGGSNARAARIVNALSAPRIDSSTVNALLTRASALELFQALQPIFWWPDTTELSLRLVDEIRRRGPEASQLSQGPNFVDVLQGMMLAYRGHVSAASELIPRWRRSSQAAILPELAFLGAIPPEAASRQLADLVRTDDWKARSVMPALAWWYHTGDTLALRESVRRTAAAPKRPHDSDALRTSAFVDQSARGFLALSRRDSANALALLAGTEDNACNRCGIERLLTARLARARGRNREAATILDRAITSNEFPVAILQRFERAQVAEILGDVPRARQEYSYVAGIWARADSSLLATARSANAALLRLGRGRAGN